MFDFVTNLWPGASRDPVPDTALVPSLPDDFPAHLPTTDTDYFRQVTSKPPAAEAYR